MANPFDPIGPSTEGKPSSLGRKLFWFGLLALAGILTVAAAAYIIRAVLFL